MTERHFPRSWHTAWAFSTLIRRFIHARRLRVLFIWPLFSNLPIWSIYVFRGLPVPTRPFSPVFHIFFVIRSSLILSTCPNQRYIPLSILVTTSSFKPQHKILYKNIFVLSNSVGYQILNLVRAVTMFKFNIHTKISSLLLQNPLCANRKLV
jgi:hypothetical protein